MLLISLKIWLSEPFKVMSGRLLDKDNRIVYFKKLDQVLRIRSQSFSSLLLSNVTCPSWMSSMCTVLWFHSIGIFNFIPLSPKRSTLHFHVLYLEYVAHFFYNFYDCILTILTCLWQNKQQFLHGR